MAQGKIGGIFRVIRMKSIEDVLINESLDVGHGLRPESDLRLVYAIP
jgi:hypothetical protein